MSQILSISALLAVFLSFTWAHQDQRPHGANRYSANHTTLSTSSCLPAAYPSPPEKPGYHGAPALRSGLDLDWRMGPDDEASEGLREEGL